MLSLSAAWNALTASILGAAAAALLLSMAGSHYAPVDSVNIVAHFWWPVLSACLVLLAWRVPRIRYPAVALLAGFAVCGVLLFSPLAAASSAQAGVQSIRIVSFNLHRSNMQAFAAAEWIMRQRADFVVLLEASPLHAPALQLLESRFPYVHDCSAHGYCSTMILSREPPLEVWPLAQGDADNRRALSAITARFELENKGVLPITAVHLQRPWPLGNQADQGDELRAAVASLEQRGVLLGDFNSAPWTFALRRLSAEGGLRLASGTPGTWPASLPSMLRLPLDQVYVGSCVAGASVRRGPDVGSDHLPLVVDLALAGCDA